jgi:PAS domain-containing protein
MDSQNKIIQAFQIEEDRDHLKAILDSMEDGIYIVGRDYRITFMNLALRSLMGNGEGQLCHEFFGHNRSTCEHCQHEMSSFGANGIGKKQEEYMK